MRKALSIAFHVVASFLLLTAIITGFIEKEPGAVKWEVVFVYAILAIVVACIGLALMRFRNWKRDTGIVLLCASGCSVFMIFTFVCLLMDEEFQKMMPPDSVQLFSDYITGGGLILVCAGLGLLLVRADQRVP